MGTTAMFPGMPARIEVGGENGTAVSENGLKFYKFRDERPTDAETQTRLAQGRTKSAGGAGSADIGLDLHARNILHILDAWENDRDAETNATEARKAVAIILAMYESARQGGAAIPVASAP